MEKKEKSRLIKNFESEITSLKKDLFLLKEM